MSRRKAQGHPARRPRPDGPQTYAESKATVAECLRMGEEIGLWHYAIDERDNVQVELTEKGRGVARDFDL